MSRKTLSQEDVARLLTERSAEARIVTATTLAGQLDRGELSEAERRLAEDIFRLMARDAEVSVRRALSTHLKESPALPHDVAVTLAHDLEAVALPVLQFSQVLTDSDLLEIVRSQGAAKQVAVASRSAVSEAVSEALVDTGDQKVVGTLVANQGAEISEQALQRVIDDFGKESAIQGSLVQRARLPVTVAERLLTVVSANLREHLVTRHLLADRIADDVMMQSRELATITLSAGADSEGVEGLVRHLHVNGRLTPSILLRAVCMGDLAFFVAGMAELAGIPILNAHKLIYDTGPRGLHSISHQAHLPDQLFPAFRCAIDVARENAFDGGELDRERFSRRMIERILTQYEALGVTFDSADLEYLLSKMNQLPTNITGQP